MALMKEVKDSVRIDANNSSCSQFESQIIFLPGAGASGFTSPAMAAGLNVDIEKLASELECRLLQAART
jgi:hypothetical protein